MLRSKDNKGHKRYKQTISRRLQSTQSRTLCEMCKFWTREERVVCFVDV